MPICKSITLFVSKVIFSGITVGPHVDQLAAGWTPTSRFNYDDTIMSQLLVSEKLSAVGLMIDHTY